MPGLRSSRLSRAENQRLDELLKALEAGSQKHFQSLITGWPKDAHSLKRVLSVLLGHLDASKIPQFASKTPAFIEGTDPLRQADKIRETLCALGGSDPLEGLNGADCAEVVELLHSHLTDLLAASEFLAAYSPLLSPKRTGFDSLQFGNVVGVSIVCKLLHYGRSIFEAEEGHSSYDTMVGFILKSWMRWIYALPLPYDTKLTPKDYGFYEPLFMGLYTCFDDKVLNKIMLARVESMPTKTLRRMIHSFAYRLVEWAVIHKPRDIAEEKQLNTQPFGSLVEAVEKLGLSRQFHVAVIKSEFIPLAVKLGWEFREAPSGRSWGGSLATLVTSSLFPPWHWPAWSLVRVVPQLLEAGLLRVIVEDYLTVGLDQPVRWHDRDPLQDLFRIAHHPKIFKSLYPALQEIHSTRSIQDRLASTIENAVNKGVTAGARMLVFGACLRVHEEVHLRALATPEPPVLCECLDHYRISGKHATPKPKPSQCSQCRTVTYCSPECQKSDWEMYHREEMCLCYRVKRINLELHGLWLSAHERMRYLLFVELAYVDALVEDDLTELHRPSQTTSVYLANTATMPVRFEAYRPNKLLSLKKGDAFMFSGERFKGLVRRGKELSTDNESIRILASISAVGGDHWIAAMGIYHQLRREVKKDGLPSFKLLAGHVRVKGPTLPDQGLSPEIQATNRAAGVHMIRRT